MMLIPNIYSNSTWIWEDYFRPIRILLNAHVQILRWKYVITIMLLNLILNLCSHSAFDFRRVSYFSFFLKKKTLKIKEGEIKKGKNNENQSVDYHTHSKILASRSSDVSITWKKKKKNIVHNTHTHRVCISSDKSVWLICAPICPLQHIYQLRWQICVQIINIQRKVRSWEFICYGSNKRMTNYDVKKRG